MGTPSSPLTQRINPGPRRPDCLQDTRHPGIGVFSTAAEVAAAKAAFVKESLRVFRTNPCALPFSISKIFRPASPELRDHSQQTKHRYQHELPGMPGGGISNIDTLERLGLPPVQGRLNCNGHLHGCPHGLGLPPVQGRLN